MDAIGRAVYLSQDGSDAAQAFAKGGEHSILYPGFAQVTAVKQPRQRFEIAYGQKALRAGNATREVKTPPAPVPKRPRCARRA